CVRLQYRRAAPKAIVADVPTGAHNARRSRAERGPARGGTGARRPGARAPGRLPTRAARARSGAAMAGAPRVLPRAGGATRRWSAPAGRARVRTERRSDARAAGGRRAALDRQLRGASWQAAEDR